MYDENLIPQIKAETDNTVKLQLVEKMYISNLHLIRAIASEQSISQDDFYDYLQLGYSAAYCEAKRPDLRSKTVAFRF